METKRQRRSFVEIFFWRLRAEVNKLLCCWLDSHWMEHREKFVCDFVWEFLESIILPTINMWRSSTVGVCSTLEEMCEFNLKSAKLTKNEPLQLVYVVITHSDSLSLSAEKYQFHCTSFFVNSFKGFLKHLKKQTQQSQFPLNTHTNCHFPSETNNTRNSVNKKIWERKKVEVLSWKLKVNIITILFFVVVGCVLALLCPIFTALTETPNPTFRHMFPF